MNKIEKLIEDQDIKRSFDLWVLNFDIKDAVGERPDLYGLINALRYGLEKYLK